VRKEAIIIQKIDGVRKSGHGRTMPVGVLLWIAVLVKVVNERFADRSLDFFFDEGP
jgi:hypothetical protein